MKPQFKKKIINGS